ncbi:ATP-dependent nuclease [Adlercreutzia mucosicola]|uniref:ATP-dependent nuclease n=1 Tax=Adlercreutzia mucosicola TaxID=580026 RepID=UPI00042699E2|nr:AAA family ATPase [Adlercreutzia mucosicola]MCR2034715.1 AAA family ATPase [Adlercreutzia mucosicola]
MKITRVQIENYRNLRSVDAQLDNLVALVGENNSGKSNFLRAIALPFASDDNNFGKNLSWFDINNEAKAEYYAFIDARKADILDGSIDAETLCQHVPVITVVVDIQGSAADGYDLKNLLVNENNSPVARLRYRWLVGDAPKLLNLTKDLLADGTDVCEIEMSLLPMNLYKHTIDVPDTIGGSRIPYETLSRFRHISLPAERDNFAASADRLGSRALVGLFQSGIDANGQKSIEQGYGDLLSTIRKAAKLDAVINWQEYSNVPNAGDFFKKISILPNMPQMSSILGSIRLGYSNESLAFQGLGHRNLILMAVMLNAYLNEDRDLSLRVVSVEEPEAHLCVNNVLLMASLLKVFGGKNTHTQILYSTHDAELVNKVGLDRVIVLHGGTASSLKQELTADELDYLTNNPNTDIFKLLFSRRLILVEGITEELLIKAYLQAHTALNDVKVLSFHKGYRNIIKIWKKVNTGSHNRLGIVRDYDNQPKAKADHDALADEQICVRTTAGYTLEEDIVKTGTNHALLVGKYGSIYGWEKMSDEDLQEDWRNNRKADVMLKICQDLIAGELAGFRMPQHIQDVLDFLLKPVDSGSSAESGIS